MPTPVLKAWVALGSVVVCVSAGFACSSGSEGGSGGAPAVNNQGGSSNGGGATQSGGGGATVMQGGGPSAGSTATAGSAGTPGTSGTGGAGGASGGTAGGGTGGLEEGDTPPWRPLNVFAAPEEHLHGNAGVDTRAPSLGKLVVDIGVNSGGYVRWAAKRGYHSIGAPCGTCPAPNLGNDRETVGNCRLEEFANTEASVKATLSDLHAQFPEEDWGYFLNEDGSVRWSDVAITGISHGATTAAVAGRIAARMWRIVSRSGPRDNECGLDGGECQLPLSTPSYDTACPDSDVAAWLDMPSLTPMNRFYGLVGTTDGQCGDIMFNMHRTGYIGVPVLFNEGGADLTTSNQYFSTEGGHYDFLAAPDGVPNTDAALNIAFGIPPENQNPDF